MYPTSTDRTNTESSGPYGYEFCKERTDVPGMGRVVQNARKSRVLASSRVIPASKGAKRQQVDWSTKDTVANALTITANGVLHTLMHSQEIPHTGRQHTRTIVAHFCCACCRSQTPFVLVLCSKNIKIKYFQVSKKRLWRLPVSLANHRTVVAQGQNFAMKLILLNIEHQS